MRSLYVVAALTACGPHRPTALQAPTCAAVAPSGGDDTANVRAAIAARCCLGPGVFDLPTPPRPRPYAMLTVAPGQLLCGTGPLTVLNFHGSAGLQDWRGVQLAGEIRDLSIDTSTLVDTSEQTHAIHVLGPAAGVRIHDLTINHPARGSQNGGDCIDAVGYAPASYVDDLSIRDVTFAHCDRAGVQIHGGARHLTIDRNSFVDTGDLDINTEPGHDSSDWLVTRNVFHASPNNQGGIAVAFDVITGARLIANTIERGVYLFGCKGCAVVGNTITAQSGHSGNQGTIDAIKGSNDLTIADNTITRVAGSDVGAVIHIGPHGTERSSGVRITGNRLEQQTPTDVVYLEGVTDACIADNDVAYTATGKASGIRAMGSGLATSEALTIVDNRFTGGLRSAVYVAGSANRAAIGSLMAARNSGAMPGLVCENMFGVLGPLTLAYNAWPPGSCGVPSKAVTLP